MSQVQEEATAALAAKHRVDPQSPDFSIISQADILGTLTQVTNTFTIFLAAVAGISLIVGGIGIMNMMLTTAGEILAKDDKSITVKLRDGGSRIVFYSDATEIGKSINGNSADLEINKTITVNGKTNSDGSITAESIQIMPAGTNLPQRQ